MTPHTPIGWILFAAMWVAGPVTGYAASSLIASVWSGETVKRRNAITFGLSGSLLAISTLLLMLIVGL